MGQNWLKWFIWIQATESSVIPVVAGFAMERAFWLIYSPLPSSSPCNFSHHIRCRSGEFSDSQRLLLWGLERHQLIGQTFPLSSGGESKVLFSHYNCTQNNLNSTHLFESRFFFWLFKSWVMLPLFKSVHSSANKEAEANINICWVDMWTLEVMNYSTYV